MRSRRVGVVVSLRLPEAVVRSRRVGVVVSLRLPEAAVRSHRAVAVARPRQTKAAGRFRSATPERAQSRRRVVVWRSRLTGPGRAQPHQRVAALHFPPAGEAQLHWRPQRAVLLPEQMRRLEEASLQVREEWTHRLARHWEAQAGFHPQKVERIPPMGSEAPCREIAES